jgi:Rrf2 family protein
VQVLAQEEYGLRCLLALARGGDGPPRTIQEVAEAEGLSPEYTAKLLAALRRAGLVRSTRGAAGGYRLARPAAAISAWEAVEALGGALFPEQFCACHAGARSGCVHEGGCALRGLWRRADRAVREVLSGASLADLAREACAAAPVLLSIDAGTGADRAGRRPS